MSGAIANNGKVWIWGKFPHEIENKSNMAIPYSLQSLINYDISDIIFNKTTVIFEYNTFNSKTTSLICLPPEKKINMLNNNITNEKFISN